MFFLGGGNTFSVFFIEKLHGFINFSEKNKKICKKRTHVHPRSHAMFFFQSKKYTVTNL